MSAKRHKLEIEIVKNRNERHLDKIKETLKQFSMKYGSKDSVVKLVECENELEKFLMEHEPRPDNIKIAKRSLNSIKECLDSVRKNECKDTMFDVFAESTLLLVKICYAQGNLAACQEYFSEINLSSLIQASPNLYLLRILSECLAIKGLCIEQDKMSAEPGIEKTALELYEQSGDLLFKYLIQRDKMYPNQSSSTTDDSIVSSVTEGAIQRAAVLHLKHKEYWKGINLLRHAMKVLHSHTYHIRQSLACKLATILLRGMSKLEYSKGIVEGDFEASSPSTSSYGISEKKSDTRNIISLGDGGSPSSLAFTNSSQAKPKFFLGEKLFSPTSVEQEAILLIRISEAMLNMDPVLDMSPVHASSREHTLLNAEFLYNLLGVALTPLGQFSLFSACIEKSLKYAFDRFHLWQQFALSLQASGKVERAIQSLGECCRIEPGNPLPALLAAKACYQQQQPPDYDEGIKFSNMALSTTKADTNDDNDGLKSVAYLCLGVGLSQKASGCLSPSESAELRKGAVEAFAMAHAADPGHHKPCLFLAVEFARARKLAKAFKKVHQALDLNPEDAQSLHLLALLQTSRKQYQEAKTTLRSALLMYPDNLSLLATKCKLELHTNEHDEALRTCDELMKLWSLKPKNVIGAGGVIGSERVTSDARSVTNQSIGTELETGSTFANSIAVSRWEQTASDLGSYADLQPRMAHVWSVHSQVWLQVAEVYLTLKRYDEAEMCVGEANQLYPLSPNVVYMRGRLHEYRDELNEACIMYNNALAIDPTYLRAIERLATILRSSGKQSYAKKLLQDAVNMDVTSHTVWRQLGEILETENDVDGTIECATLSLNLEMTSPVVPFSVIGLEL
uniref:Tetratricopeptide repeat protein 7B-like n=1 Tax=Phallusia mammillata TaxID=59560 RepID=A0A6F9DWJ4_9ASCI|nr:tetratricopeptide repeat protein 7B-like [Phallusia mammillata]